MMDAPDQRRSKIWKPSIALLAVLGGSIGLVGWHFYDLRRMDMSLRKMIDSADSVVVYVHLFQPKPSSAYYRLDGEARADFLSHLATLSEPVAGREYASAYWVSVHVYDAKGTCYGIIWVQPGLKAVDNQQMESLIAEASKGESLDRDDIDQRPDWADREQRPPWILSRKCMK
jgi:hypothetical protein